ncbi:MAG: sugar-binding transcriptional regulator [Gracilibacteraceae bacterium]|nr:sugar-binding transcriptional regulator [Gracilibacteraceae bacterium]
MFAYRMVYEQSLNLILKAAHLYYNCDVPQVEIAQRLGISTPTVSRLLKKAREKQIVRFCIQDSYIECIKMEKELKRLLGLDEVIIAPINEDNRNDPEKIKMSVALEAARYVQRIIREEDIIGVAWGRTMYYLIHFLNPSQKTNSNFVTLNGNLAGLNVELDAHSLVDRIAMAFGGTRHSLFCEALQRDKETAACLKKKRTVRDVYEQYNHITISISGIGSLYPRLDSPLAQIQYLSKEELEILRQANVYGDLMLRFFDYEGNECKTPLSDRTIAIDFETYRKIPTKIIAASGAFKSETLFAALKGRLIDVLIIDKALANALYSRALQSA